MLYVLPTTISDLTLQLQVKRANSFRILLILIDNINHLILAFHLKKRGVFPSESTVSTAAHFARTDAKRASFVDTLKRQRNQGRKVNSSKPEISRIAGNGLTLPVSVAYPVCEVQLHVIKAEE